jgi:predicted HTH transcriptional regulator
MEVKKEPKIRMGATRRNLFLRSKMKTNSSDPEGEVSNLKASFKNRADKISMWTAMKSRQTAE